MTEKNFDVSVMLDAPIPAESLIMAGDRLAQDETVIEFEIVATYLDGGKRRFRWERAKRTEALSKRTKE